MIQYCPRQNVCISCYLQNKTQDAAQQKALERTVVGLLIYFQNQVSLEGVTLYLSASNKNKRNKKNPTQTSSKKQKKPTSKIKPKNPPKTPKEQSNKNQAETKKTKQKRKRNQNPQKPTNVVLCNQIPSVVRLKQKQCGIS